MFMKSLDMVTIFTLCAVAVVIVSLLPRVLKRAVAVSDGATKGEGSRLPYSLTAAPFYFFVIGIVGGLYMTELRVLGAGMVLFGVATAMSAFSAKHYSRAALDMKDPAALYESSKNIPIWFKRINVGCFVIAAVVTTIGLLYLVASLFV